jgi:hypothetical protein
VTAPHSILISRSHVSLSFTRALLSVSGPVFLLVLLVLRSPIGAAISARRPGLGCGAGLRAGAVKAAPDPFFAVTTDFLSCCDSDFCR